MTKCNLSLLAAAFVLLPLLAGSVLATPKELFNGHDLSGWVAMYGGE